MASRLNVDRLRALHALSDQGTIGAAADALHVTPSAVSQQLAKLEQEAGHRLVEPNGRGVRLTDAGQVLVSHARAILSILEQAEAELEANAEGVSGNLGIAAFATAARGLAPRALASLRRNHAALNVTFRELEPGDALPRLLRRDIDIAVVQDWFNAPLALPEGLKKAPLLDDVADIALGIDHPLSRRAQPVALSELANEPWITWPAQSICQDWLLHTLRSQGHEPRIAHTAESATQLELVGAGLGAAVTPRLGRGPVPAGVTILPSVPTLRRHVYAVWRADATRRKAIAAGVEALGEAAALVEVRDVRAS